MLLLGTRDRFIVCNSDNSNCRVVSTTIDNDNDRTSATTTSSNTSGAGGLATQAAWQTASCSVVRRDGLTALAATRAPMHEIPANSPFPRTSATSSLQAAATNIRRHTTSTTAHAHAVQRPTLRTTKTKTIHRQHNENGNHSSALLCNVMQRSEMHCKAMQCCANQ